MTTIIGIDPGPSTSGFVVMETGRGVLPCVRWSDAAVDSADLARLAASALIDYDPAIVAIEWLTTYGRAVGASVLDTARIVGQVEGVLKERRSHAEVVLVTRPDVCHELCQSRSATKAQVRAACLAIYSAEGVPQGGGACRQVGTKRDPGPLYGVRSHAWDALATALAAWRRRTDGR